MSKKKPISKADLNLSAAKSVNKAMAPKPKQAVPAPANPAPAAKPPNVFKMMKSFGKDLSKYVLAGAPNCTKDDYKERLLTCDACPHLLRHLMRCGKCGCLVEHKAKWKTTTCPDGKWKEQDLSDLPKPNPNPDGEKQG
tara:strand:- start:1941 stop:2357 length:417 start_codon:yes stop_codon:yes gene_type:complete